MNSTLVSSKLSITPQLRREIEEMEDGLGTSLFIIRFKDGSSMTKRGKSAASAFVGAGYNSSVLDRVSCIEQFDVRVSP